MNTLELKAYHVNELNQHAQKETNGGILMMLACIGVGFAAGYLAAKYL
jgi:F0F1-type ATP synthase membrane subunit c/vacuolar-type H+-ATPase subunit K